MKRTLSGRAASLKSLKCEWLKKSIIREVFVYYALSQSYPFYSLSTLKILNLDKDCKKYTCFLKVFAIKCNCEINHELIF